MSGTDPALLREARTFAVLLSGEPPRPKVMEAYQEAHRVHPEWFAGSKFQRDLIVTASRGVATARMADGYARLLDPHGPLRRKLVLMLAILECTPPTHRTLDAPLGGSPSRAFPRLVVLGLRSVACTVAGLLLFTPRRWFSGGET